MRMENYQFWILLTTNVLINGTVALIAYRIGVYHKLKMDSMEAEVISAIDQVQAKIEDPGTFQALSNAIIDTVSQRVTSSLYGMYGKTAQMLNEGGATNKTQALMDIVFSRNKKKAIQANAGILFGKKPEEIVPEVEQVAPNQTLQEYADALAADGIPLEAAKVLIEKKALKLGLGKVNIDT